MADLYRDEVLRRFQTGEIDEPTTRAVLEKHYTELAAAPTDVAPPAEVPAEPVAEPTTAQKLLNPLGASAGQFASALLRTQAGFRDYVGLPNDDAVAQRQEIDAGTSAQLGPEMRALQERVGAMPWQKQVKYYAKNPAFTVGQVGGQAPNIALSAATAGLGEGAVAARFAGAGAKAAIKRGLARWTIGSAGAAPAILPQEIAAAQEAQEKKGQQPDFGSDVVSGLLSTALEGVGDAASAGVWHGLGKIAGGGAAVAATGVRDMVREWAKRGVPPETQRAVLSKLGKGFYDLGATALGNAAEEWLQSVSENAPAQITAREPLLAPAVLKDAAQSAVAGGFIGLAQGGGPIALNTAVETKQAADAAATGRYALIKEARDLGIPSAHTINNKALLEQINQVKRGQAEEASRGGGPQAASTPPGAPPVAPPGVAPAPVETQPAEAAGAQETQPAEAAGAQETPPAAKPGEAPTITTETMARAFPTATKIEQNVEGGGHFVHLPGDRMIWVMPTGEIQINKAAAREAGYSEEQIANGKALGSWQPIGRDAIIKLVNGGELHHELFHDAAEFALTPQELLAVDAAHNGDWEAAARDFNGWQASQPTKSAGAWAKVKEFWTRVKDAVTPATEEGTFRAVQSGAAHARTDGVLGEEGVREAAAPEAMPDRQPGETAEQYMVRAFHGTPHKITKRKGFTLDKSGSGEGAAAYGWGAYFAGKREVAEAYKTAGAPSEHKVTFQGKEVEPNAMGAQPERIAVRALEKYGTVEAATKALRDEVAGYQSGLAAASVGPAATAKFHAFAKEVTTNNGAAITWMQQHAQTGALAAAPREGNLYHANLDVNDDQLLDWGKPLSEQSAPVQKALKAAGHELLPMASVGPPTNQTGADFYRRISQRLRHTGDAKIRAADEAASRYLASIGIPGIKYLDAGSRDAGVGTHNYVIFDDKLIDLTHRNDKRMRYSLVGQQAKNWEKIPGKFSGIYDQQQRAEISDLGMTFRAEPVKRTNKNPGIVVRRSDGLITRGVHPQALSTLEEGTVHGTLGTIFDHKELFRAYPSLRNLPVDLTLIPGKYEAGVGEGGTLLKGGAAFNKARFTQAERITVQASDWEGAMNSLVHEIQHAIQQKEGFTGGTSPQQMHLAGSRFVLQGFKDRVRNTWAAILPGAQGALVPQDDARPPSDLVRAERAFANYTDTVGEMDARNAAHRRTFTPEQRKELGPWRGEQPIERDIPLTTERQDAALRFGAPVPGAVITQSVKAPPGPAIVDTQRGVVLPRYSIETLKSGEQYYARQMADLVQRDIASQQQTRKFVRDMRSIAAQVVNTPLDYTAEGRGQFSAVKPNGDPQYGWSVDFTTICRKTAALFDTVSEIMRRNQQGLTADAIQNIRQDLKDAGETVNCQACYVFSRWVNMGNILDDMAQHFPAVPRDLIFDPRRSAELKAQHPDAWAWKQGRGSGAGKAVETRTEYVPGELKRHFNPKQVEVQNRFSGVRLQSWSDFDARHVIDNAQVIADLVDAQLAAHGYTKVGDFADLMAPTGVMVNLSLIPRGSGLESGILAFDDTEGMPAVEAFRLREKHRTAGTIVIGANDQHLLALMRDPRVDYVIPYHASGLSKEFQRRGGMDSWTDYGAPNRARGGSLQSDVVVNPKLFARRVARLQEETGMTAAQAKRIMPWEYWDENSTGDENSRRFISYAKSVGVRPRFDHLLNTAHDAPPGWWKLLIDRRMYDGSGQYIAQQPVQLKVNMGVVRRIFNRFLNGARPHDFGAPHEATVAKYTERSAQRSTKEKFSLAPQEAGAATSTPETLNAQYPRASNTVDGRVVRDETPNMGSIDSSFTSHVLLPGVREVPMSDFAVTGTHYSASGNRRIADLAEQIESSGEIAPLIVAVDAGGPYILEGATRIDALYRLGAKSFPARVVLDTSSSAPREKYSIAGARATPEGPKYAKYPGTGAGRVNMHRIDASPEVKAFIRDEVQTVAPGAWERATRTVSDADAIALAQDATKASAHLRQILKLKPGEVLPDEVGLYLGYLHATRAQEAAEALAAYTADRTPENKLKMLDTQAAYEAIMQRERGNSAATGRALGRRRLIKQALEQMRAASESRKDAIARTVIDRTGTGLAAADLDALTAIPEGDVIAHAKFLQAHLTEKPSFWDWVNAYRYTNMLLSPGTQITNIVGNAVMLPVDVATRILSDPANRATYAGLAAHGWAYGESAKDALQVLRHGVSEKQAQGLLEENSKLGKKGDLPGGLANPLTWATRMLNAADVFFKDANIRGEVVRIAMNQVLDSGVEYGSAEYKEALEAALRDPDVLDRADKSARKSVFQQDTPVLSKINSGMRAIPGVHGSAIRATWGLLVPFSRIAVNLSKRFAELTPGVGAVQLLDKEKWATDKARGARVVVAQQAISLAAMMALSALAAAGKIDLTVGAPDDPREKDKFYEDGKKPWAIRIGDKWIDMRKLGPIAAFILPAAVLHDRASREEQFSPDALLEMIAKQSKMMLDQSFVQGINGVLDMIENPERGRQRGASLVANTIRQFVPLSGALAGAARAIDPNMRHVDSADYWTSIGRRIVAGLPATSRTMGSTDLPVKVDGLGRPTEKHGETGIYAILPIKRDDPENDPVVRELRRLDEGVADKSKLAYPSSATLTEQRLGRKPKPEEQRNYQEAVGAALYARAKEILRDPSYQGRSIAGRRQWMRKALEHAKTRAGRDTSKTMGAQ